MAAGRHVASHPDVHDRVHSSVHRSFARRQVDLARDVVRLLPASYQGQHPRV